MKTTKLACLIVLLGLLLPLCALADTYDTHTLVAITASGEAVQFSTT